MSKKFDLLSSVAVVALVASASGAFAQSNVTQTTHNDKRMNVSGNVSVGNVSGHGASVTITASGAQSAVPNTFINTGADVNYGTISQTTTHAPAPVSDPTPEIGASGPMFFGDVTGKGATVQKSATAAASQVSANFINAGGNVSFEDITQNTQSNTSRRIEASGEIHNGSGPGFSITGDGASVSISATAAASSVGVLGIGSSAGQSLGNVSIGDVGQTTTAGGASQVQTNTANIAGNGNAGLRAVSGAGASASISATGAVSSVSVGRIDGNSSPTWTDIGNVSQSTTYAVNQSVSNSGVFLNKYDGTEGLDGGITGNGASVTSGVTGAISSLSVSSINSAGTTDVDVGNITQTTKALAPNPGSWAQINNNGGIDGSRTGHVSGMGATASVSAAGAVSIASVSAINSAAPGQIRFGVINQTTHNNYPVTNTVTSDADTITLGNVSGAGASVTAGASGATSAVSFSSIGNKWSNTTPSITTGTINQETINYGSVSNTGLNGPARITVGNISGNGASVSISAAGATSQVAVTSINDTKVASANLGNITQTTYNYGNVSNSGVINAGNVSGMGASAGVSSVGASSVVARTVIK